MQLLQMKVSAMAPCFAALALALGAREWRLRPFSSGFGDLLGEGLLRGLLLRRQGLRRVHQALPLDVAAEATDATLAIRVDVVFAGQPVRHGGWRGLMLKQRPGYDYNKYTYHKSILTKKYYTYRTTI